jgi:hypothetical protein
MKNIKGFLVIGVIALVAVAVAFRVKAIGKFVFPAATEA